MGNIEIRPPGKLSVFWRWRLLDEIGRPVLMGDRARCRTREAAIAAARYALDEARDAAIEVRC